MTIEMLAATSSSSRKAREPVLLGDAVELGLQRRLDVVACLLQLRSHRGEVGLRGDEVLHLRVGELDLLDRLVLRLLRHARAAPERNAPSIRPSQDIKRCRACRIGASPLVFMVRSCGFERRSRPRFCDRFRRRWAQYRRRVSLACGHCPKSPRTASGLAELVRYTQPLGAGTYAAGGILHTTHI